jgi:hypothetical protein
MTRNYTKWTPEEDEKLKDLVVAYPSHPWKLIASLHGTRTELQCQKHYYSLAANGQSKTRPFTSKEDSQILSWVSKFGPINFSQLARLLHRTSDITEKRWTDHLNPYMANPPWPLQDSLKLLSLYIHKGSQWKAFTRLFSNRSRQNVIGHFFAFIAQEMNLIGEKMGVEERYTVKEVRRMGANEVLEYAKVVFEEVTERAETKKTNVVKETILRVKKVFEQMGDDENNF